MARANSPSFIVELPLTVDRAAARTLDVRFDAARQLYNAALGEALRRFDLMRQSRAYQRARATPKMIDKKPNPERRDAFKRARIPFAFFSSDVEKFTNACRKACWIGHHVGSMDGQKLANRAYAAVERHMFGNLGRPRFKRLGELQSVEAKRNNECIGWNGSTVYWGHVMMPARIERGDRWLAEALKARTKYVRIVRRGGRYAAQLVQEGESPLKHAHRRGKGAVGLDLGPSTIAAVGDGDAFLEKFCPEVEVPAAELKRIARAIDRSRRATNPGNFNADGTIKKRPKRWLKSGRYRALQAKRAHVERKLAAARKTAHGRLVNRVTALGDTIKLEKVSYRAFQRVFGKSVGARAPGAFVARLKQRANRLRIPVVEIDTRATRLSQLDHTTGEYVKKPLSQRWHALGKGNGKVQRDLYSAFLARFCSENSFDARQAALAWPGADTLLQRAASEVVNRQTAAGSPLPAAVRVHPTAARAGRPSKTISQPTRPAMPVGAALAVSESAGESAGSIVRAPIFRLGQCQRAREPAPGARATPGLASR